MSDETVRPNPESAAADSEHDYGWKLQKEAEFWGTMARLRWRDGIPMTMDFTRATCYRVRRSELGWGDYYQDPFLDRLTPFGRARIDFVKAVREAPGTRALDLGCGAGWLALEQARAGKEVDALDISSQEFEVAQEYQATLQEHIPGRIHWKITDLNHYQAPEATYDHVTAWDSLHHIPQIDRLLAQLHKALKPGGRLFISERLWGGQNPSVRARIGRYVELHLWTLLPTLAPMTYKVKFRELAGAYGALIRSKILRRKTDSTPWQVEGEYCSPFEDSCGREMLDTVAKYFEIERLDWYGGFSEEIQRSLALPRFLRVPVLVVLSWIDQATLKLGLLEGKIAVVHATRKSRGTDSAQ